MTRPCTCRQLLSFGKFTRLKLIHMPPWRCHKQNQSSSCSSVGCGRIRSPQLVQFTRKQSFCCCVGHDHLQWSRTLTRHMIRTPSGHVSMGTIKRITSDAAMPNSLLLKITEFDDKGNYVTRVIRKSELLFQHGIQARDVRFSTFSSLYVRASSIILRLQHIKAIINSDSFVLLESDHPAIQMFLPELQERLKALVDEDTLPFEFRVLEAMLMKMFTVLDGRLQELEPALRDILNSLLDPRLFSVDRGELHILLHHSKSLSEFHSIVRDIEATLSEVLDNEEDMADMYLSHWSSTGEDRETDEIEELNNILESYLMQAENILSEIQKLRELIDQSESIILINLDSQRNVMLRLGLQLEMGMFSATLCGLVGMAFGMNLESSLEEHPYAFWVATGIMFTGTGLLWRRLLMFLGKNLDRTPIKRLAKPKRP